MPLEFSVIRRARCWGSTIGWTADNVFLDRLQIIDEALMHVYVFGRVYDESIFKDIEQNPIKGVFHFTLLISFHSVTHYEFNSHFIYYVSSF